MEKRNISFSPPDISESEIEAVGEVLRSGWITTGPKTKLLEKELNGYIFGNEEAGRVVCLNSATAAEELILRILGIGKGDQVIVPAFTYTATAAAAIHVGAEVIFIDSQPDNVEMDYDAVEKAITSSTKAIIPVDIGGVICDYEKIFNIVEKARNKFVSNGGNNLGDKIQRSLGRIAIIADCAHALGAKRKIGNSWTNAGNIADFSSFSFHAVKNLTTAEGGAASWRSIEGVDDAEIYQAFQLMSLHGQNKDALAKMNGQNAWEYDIVAPYFKCNMTDIMAAIGIKQLERYPKLLNRRREIIEKYDKAMDRAGIWHVEHYTNEVLSSGHLYQTRVSEINELKRNKIIEKMGKAGIACNVHYKPLPMMTAYKQFEFDIADYPNAYGMYKNEVTLPLHTRLTDAEVNYVIKNYVEVVKEYI